MKEFSTHPKTDLQTNKSGGIRLCPKCIVVLQPGDQRNPGGNPVTIDIEGQLVYNVDYYKEKR